MKSEGKTNILFVLPNFDTGGSEKLVFDIIKDIDQDKFAPVLCVFFSGKYEEEFKKLNVPFYVVHRDSIKSKLKVAGFISEIVSKHKIDVVNTHHTSPLLQGVIPFKILNRVKWFHTEHICLNLDPNVKPVHHILTKICLKFVDRAIGISNGVCEYFKNELGVPEKKVVKVLNGIEVEKFRIMDNGKSRREKRKELGIGEEDIVIGMFANFRRQKNHQCLIRAFALLKQRTEYGKRSTEESDDSPLSIIRHPPSFKLILAGEGPEFDNIINLCRDLGLDFFDFNEGLPDSALCSPFSVLFLRSRTDIPELMNAIDIYCLPSHFEGLPFSLIEAFAAGKQMVATDVIGNRDVVQEMGSGLLVKPNDPEALAEALLRSAEHGERSTENLLSLPDRQAGVDRFPFSFKNMLQKYEQLFSGRA